MVKHAGLFNDWGDLTKKHLANKDITDQLKVTNEKNKQIRGDELRAVLQNDHVPVKSQLTREQEQEAGRKKLALGNKWSDYKPNNGEFEFTGRDQTFWEDVGTSFSMEGIQLWLAQEQDNIASGYREAGYDQSFNPYTKENLAGYEAYVNDFGDVINEKHMDAIKVGIDRVNRKEERLARGDRLMARMVGGAIGDPSMLIGTFSGLGLLGSTTMKLTRTLMRGSSFARRAGKSGAITAGAMSPNEYLRRKYDYNSTWQESAMLLGIGGLMGGLMGGMVGAKTVKTGKAMVNKRFTQNPNTKQWSYTEPELQQPFMNSPTFTGMYPNKAERLAVLYDDAFRLIEETDATPLWTYKFINDVTGSVEKISNRFKKSIGFNKATKTSKPTIKINSRKLLDDWNNETPNMRNRIGSFENYQQLKVKQLFITEVQGEGRKVSRTTGEFIESERDFELRTLDLAYREFQKEASKGSLARSNIFSKAFNNLEKLTNAGKVTANGVFKNTKVGRYMQESMIALSGDHSTMSEVNRAGGATKSSVALAIRRNHEIPLANILRNNDEAWVRFRMDDEESTYLASFNQTKNKLRISDFKGKTEGQSVAEFRADISRAISDDTFYATTNKYVRQQADEMTAYFEKTGKDMDLYGISNNKTSVTNFKLAKQTIIDDLEKTLASDTELNAFQKGKLNEILDSEKALIKDLDTQLGDLAKESQLKGLNIHNKEKYLPRVYNKDAIIANKTVFINMLSDFFQSPIGRKNVINKETGEITQLSSSKTETMKRARKVYNHILTVESDDIEGILGKALDDEGNVTYGAKQFMSRNLNIPNKMLTKQYNGVEDFIELDSSVIMRQYTQRAGTAIEIAKRFGDANMSNWTVDARIKLLTGEIKSTKDMTKYNRIINAFTDEKGKMTGTINLQDSSARSKKVAEGLMNIASTTMMGRVVYSAVVDVARPVMVHGLQKVAGQVFRQAFGNNRIAYLKALKQNKGLGATIDTELGMAKKRFMVEAGQITPSNRGTGLFGKALNKLNELQPSWFVVNGLTPWTQKMKDFEAVIGHQEILNDAINMSKGKASRHTINRMASMGIDETTAKTIARMPWEEVDGMRLANVDKWLSKKGGENASIKFQEALYAETDRAIVTPHIVDQLNIMHGQSRINSPKGNAFWNNAVGRKLGYKKGQDGGSMNNALLALPMQFMSWGVSANRKVVMAGMSGKDKNFVGGLMSMLFMGGISLYMKTPHDRFMAMSDEERFIRAIEISGVLGVMSDLSFNIENLTMGNVGLRPLLGVKGRFGKENLADAISEPLGASGGLMMGLAHSFLTENSQANRVGVLRRATPFNNLFYTKDLFRKIYDPLAKTVIKGSDFGE